MQFMEIVWLCAIVVFGILEAATVQLVCIWFAGGALGALIAALAGADTMYQAVIFVALSVILLLCTRPLEKKLTRGNTLKTNADGLIGERVIITKAPDSLGEHGEARAGGAVWTVRSQGGQPLCEGDAVTVEKIEGVKLIVKK